MTDGISFADWLNEKLREHNLSQAGLARAGGDMFRAHYLHSLASNFALPASNLEQGLLALETARLMI